MKFKDIFVSVIALCLAACAAGKEAKEVKLYEKDLGTMLGGDLNEVSNRICFEWKFGLADEWKGENPSVETVLKNNHRLTGFSKEEAGDVFSSPGKYQVRVFVRSIAQESKKIGSIDQYGKSFGDQNTIYTSESHSYIRAVFRDGKLIHYRVWASLG